MAKSNQRFYVDIMTARQAVTGTCILAIVKYPDGNSVKFVVDCGLFQGRDITKEEKHDDSKHQVDIRNEKLPFNPEGVSFMLITHNHIDHTGRIPLMFKKGYVGPVYVSAPTSKLISPALHDSLRALKELAKRNNRKSLFDEGDLNQALSSIKPCEYRKEFEPYNGIKVTFFENDHLVGAASILVKITYPGSEDINILFAGDYNNTNIFMEHHELPDEVFNLPLTIVNESTYGDMDSSEIVPCFERNIIENLNNGGVNIIPVFSLGRAQEVLYKIKQMQDDGKISMDVVNYYDGNLSHTYSRLYKSDIIGIKAEMEDFMPKNIEMVDKTTRPAVLQTKGPANIITTSGMGSYGPAQMYIPQYLGNKKALIHFTGYTAEGSLGARLKNAEDGEMVQISGLMVKKRARIEYTTEWSAHAKADEMIGFLKKFNRIKMIIVNHGETSTKQVFAERIVDEIDPKNVGILGEDYFFRVGPYGLIKTLGTKFE